MSRVQKQACQKATGQTRLRATSVGRSPREHQKGRIHTRAPGIRLPLTSPRGERNGTQDTGSAMNRRNTCQYLSKRGEQRGNRGEYPPHARKYIKKGLIR